MRVFIYGGYIPSGGTYMAYLLGRILHEDFGLEVVIVTLHEETIENSILSYPCEFDTIHCGLLKGTITSQDLLIVNPSFSERMMGLQYPGRKLMYVQGFQTFSVIDGFFDRYVSVSNFVAEFLKTTYNINSTVIPACLMTEHMPSPIPWERKADLIIVPIFKQIPYTSVLVESFLRKYAESYQDIEQKCEILRKKVPQDELWAIFNGHRYLLTLTPAEGFGLMPLEAMAFGTAVIGFDGIGGKQYMKDGINCSVARYPDLNSVIVKTHEITSMSAKAKCQALSGIQTAKNYDFF